uniref:Signal peptidase complex subunit 2 n=1 Tax=Theileria annulata TaxID=5874 RepID=A0A3B0MW52_THEAN
MAEDKPLSEVYKNVVYSVSDLYSYTDLQKLMDSNTRAAFKEIGLKIDNNVIYFRLAFYLLLNAVGAYTTFFVHVEKSKFLLKVMLIVFFSLFSVYIAYDKVLLCRAHFVVKLKYGQELRGWKELLKLVRYKRKGRKNRTETYTLPLGDLFFSDGECDYDHFVKLMEKLKPTLLSLDRKTKKQD